MTELPLVPPPSRACVSRSLHFPPTLVHFSYALGRFGLPCLVLPCLVCVCVSLSLLLSVAREQLHIVHKVTDAEVDTAKTLLKNHLYQQVKRRIAARSPHPVVSFALPRAVRSLFLFSSRCRGVHFSVHTLLRRWKFTVLASAPSVFCLLFSFRVSHRRLPCIAPLFNPPPPSPNPCVFGYAVPTPSTSSYSSTPVCPSSLSRCSP